MRVHLIDGTYELFRCYYGPPGSKAPDGQEVGATRALLRSLWSLLRASDVTHLAVAFDHTVESFRNELFDGYKTGEGMDPELWAQFPLAEEAAKALGIVVWPMVDFEADDALATAAARFAAAEGLTQVVIASPDKDLAQCVVGERVVLWDRRRQKILDESAVIEKFGVPPKSIPDFLALVGDSADGLPGVPRWGAKTSAQVLAEYGDLASIPDVHEHWRIKVRGAAGLAAQLKAHRKDAELYRRLATLRTDVPLDEDLAALRWQRPDLRALGALCERLGDERFFAEVERSQR